MTEKQCKNCYWYSLNDGEMRCIYSTPSIKILHESLAEDCEYFEIPKLFIRSVYCDSGYSFSDDNKIKW